MGRWQRHSVPSEILAVPSEPVGTAQENFDSASKVNLDNPVKLKASVDPVGAVTCRYIWRDEERTATFPEDGSADVAGALPSAPSGPLKDYEDKLKAIDMCARGVGKAEIAACIVRSENWVKRWWKQNPHLIPKPAVRHGPLVRNAPLLSFRDLELRRGFALDLAEGSDGGPPLDEELLSALKWEPARRATRCPETGELRVRFDTSGSSMAQPGRFVAQYSGGGVRRLDALLQRMAAAAGIRDPGSRVFLNRYESGEATCPVHRHDFWTAMVSFGAGRVAIVEENPFLLRQGDLLVFGTQSHGAPAMPDVGRRRISVVVFFRPDADNIERRWLTLEGNREEEEADGADSRTAALAPALAHLVDSDLCGCPGISLGLVSRRGARAKAPVTIFTIGCGLLPEAAFFQRLGRAGAAELWDVRRSAGAAPSRWEPQQLKRLCAVRALRYRWQPLGRSEAGGIHRHLDSEEGRDVLAKMVLSASEGRGVAILGHSEQWSGCDRCAVASLLASGEFGPVSVLHVTASGFEPHPGGSAEPQSQDSVDVRSSSGEKPSEKAPDPSARNRFRRSRVDASPPAEDLKA